MIRLLALAADYWLLAALGAVVLAAVALVGFGRRPRVWWPVLAGLGPVRRWVALSVRCLLVALLVLALAAPRLRRPNENVCVLYVVDRSMSVPQETDTSSAEGERDLRWLRLQQFIHASVQQR